MPELISRRKMLTTTMAAGAALVATPLAAVPLPDVGPLQRSKLPHLVMRLLVGWLVAEDKCLGMVTGIDRVRAHDGMADTELRFTFNMINLRFGDFYRYGNVASENKPLTVIPSRGFQWNSFNQHGGLVGTTCDALKIYQPIIIECNLHNTDFTSYFGMKFGTARVGYTASDMMPFSDEKLDRIFDRLQKD